MTGPRLAYVALVATVFGPFRPFNTKTFQNFVSDRRSGYVWSNVVRCDFTSSVWVGIVEIRTRYFKLTRA